MLNKYGAAAQQREQHIVALSVLSIVGCMVRSKAKHRHSAGICVYKIRDEQSCKQATKVVLSDVENYILQCICEK